MYKLLIVVGNKLQHELIYHNTDITQQNINLSIWDGSENSVSINGNVLQHIHNLKIEGRQTKANYFGGEHYIVNHRRLGAAVMSHTFIEYEFDNMYFSRKYLFYVKDITWDSQTLQTTITFTSFLTGGSQGDNNTSNLLNFPLPISKQNFYVPSAMNRNFNNKPHIDNTLFGGSKDDNIWTKLANMNDKQNPISVLWEDCKHHIINLPFGFEIKYHNTLYGDANKIQDLYKVRKSMARNLTNLKKYIHPGANFGKTILYLCRKFQYYYWFEWNYKDNELVMYISDIGFSHATLTEETPGVQVISHKFYPNKIKHYALYDNAQPTKRVASDIVMRYDEYEFKRHLEISGWNRLQGTDINPNTGNQDMAVDPEENYLKHQIMPPLKHVIGESYGGYWPKEFYFVNGAEYANAHIENIGDKKDIDGFYAFLRSRNKYILYFNKLNSSEIDDGKKYQRWKTTESDKPIKETVDFNDVKHMWIRPLALANLKDLKHGTSIKDWQLWRESKYHPYSVRSLDESITTQNPIYEYEKRFYFDENEPEDTYRGDRVVAKGSSVDWAEANKGWWNDISSYGVKNTKNFDNYVRTISSQFTLLKSGEEQVLNNWDTTINEIELTYDLSKNDVNGFKHLMPGVYISVQYRGYIYTQLVTEIEISDAKILRITIGDKSRGMYALSWPEEFSL